MHDILTFHKVHGSGIVLSDGGGVATRTQDFCNGIAFSARPLKLGQKVCLELTRTTVWSGAIRIGVTRNDPGRKSAKGLPRYVCPDLTDQEGTWARPLNEKYSETGTRITFYVNNSGQMHYFVNNEHKGVFLDHLPSRTTLWAVFDIYGNTIAAKYTQPDEAPVEILARGPAALRAYHSACESGTQPVFRTRLMLVGQDRVGKTSLKKSLTGQRYDSAEVSTDGIDLSASCSFNTRDNTSWRLALTQGDLSPTPPDGGPPSPLTHSAGAVNLEEEYHCALATNIVQELLFHRQQQQDEEEEKGDGDSTWHTDRLSHDTHTICALHGKGSDTQTTQEVSLHMPSLQKNVSEGATKPLPMGRKPVPRKPSSANIKAHQLLQEMPEQVVQLVEELLLEHEEKGLTSDLSQRPSLDDPDQSGRNIILNIWDFAGQAVYYTTHQVFLSSRAVYIIVFNLCNGLDELAKIPVRTPHIDGEEVDCEVGDLTNLDYMDYWMNAIHAHAAQNTRNSVDNHTLSPPIFLVGTHRLSLDSDPVMQEKLAEQQFDRIRLHMVGKSYQQHVVPHFYAVENSLQHQKDDQVSALRRHVEEVASREPYMGEQIPIRWLALEQSLTNLVAAGTHFSSLDQMSEVARSEGITSNEELRTLLEFYHDLGVLIHYGADATLDTTLHNTVILNPQWLIDMFKRVITAIPPFSDQWDTHHVMWGRLESVGVLEERLLNYMWADTLQQKAALLGLMEKFDLIAEKIMPKSVAGHVADKLGRCFYVPARLQKSTAHTARLYSRHHLDVIFYADFNGFCPDGLFHRVLTRAVRWSQECGGHEPKLYHRASRLFLDSEHDFCLQLAAISLARIKVTVVRVVSLDEGEESSSVLTRAVRWSQECGGHEPKLYHRASRLFLDSEHDFCLQLAAISLARIKVTVVRVVSLDEGEESSSGSEVERELPPPRPAACARVRHFLESTLCELREMWMKRISYCVVVECGCDRLCVLHAAPHCQEEECVHFLSLDECISNKIVCCEHRRIKTSQYRKWFPESMPSAKTGPIFPDTLVQSTKETFGNIEAKRPEMPMWVRSAAKLLNGGCEGQDWMALAQKMGYKKFKTDKLNDDLNPGLALITDWIISSGNTPLSIDLMVTFLEQMTRDDIVEIIQKGQESEEVPRQVFVSYQWDSQDEVTTLRDRLEKAGYSCWMDIGQMGGGDHLYTRIDEGIRNAKVVIACITPKYIVSQLCNKEISLADLLCKPIIPVMYEVTPWPPPGGMALMFSQLIYINMKGVGGHGGVGIHADLENKHQEILQRVSAFATGKPRPPLHSTPPAPPHDMDPSNHLLDLTPAEHSSLHSLNSNEHIDTDPLIPGYAQNEPVATRATLGAIAVGRAAPGRNTARPLVGGARSASHDLVLPVEQVHVTKCAVCVIL